MSFSTITSARRLFDRYVRPRYKHKQFNPDKVIDIKYNYYVYDFDGVRIMRQPIGGFLNVCDRSSFASNYVVQVDGITILDGQAYSLRE